MRELKVAVTDFVKADFNWAIYGITMLFLAVALFINYSSSIDLNLFDLHSGVWGRSAYYASLFGGTYFFTSVIAAKNAEKRYLTNSWFWILSLLFVFIAAIPKLHVLKVMDVRAHGWDIHQMVFASRSHFFFNQMVITLCGLAIIKALFRKWTTIDYGFRFNWGVLKPYFLVLALVAPLVIIASFFPAFQKAYPQYRPWEHLDVFGLSILGQASIFELCYSTGFLAVEALFRGALAITMVNIMGRRAILPMASLYCVFHFGKPAGEAIGAFFGGYALGVMAVHSRSILGGLTVHLGVALLMELMGYLHHHA